MVLLLVLLVAGLLRSHADILRALHDLGAGVGDPSGAGEPHRPAGAGATSGPLQIGPPLPGERNATAAPDLAGVSPDGDAVAVAVTGTAQRTLLAFLSSGCATCAGFWDALTAPARSGLPPEVRVVAVTKGPEAEIPAEVRRRAAGVITVVMSTAAWSDYEVPGSPFFVLVDGAQGRRIGEGVANQLSQVAELVRRAVADEGPPAPGTGSRSRAFATGLTGPARESRNDAELAAAGILPGHSSLYPGSLEDLFAPTPGPPGEGRHAEAG